MNQPPKPTRLPLWRRPLGVSPGTWDYVNERTIADHYDAFVADTPLCRLDQQIVAGEFPLLNLDNSLANSVSILDLGCGSGRVALPLASRGYEVIGVDLSNRMLEVMLEKSRTAELRGSVHAVRANLVELDGFADHSIDHAICMFSTLGMIKGRQYRQQLLRHVARILRPAGKLVVHVHNRWAVLREPKGPQRVIGSYLRSRFHSEHEFGDYIYSYRGLSKMFMHRFSRRELAADLVHCGWKIDRIERVTADGQSLLHGYHFFPPGGFVAIGTKGD
ncbi:class I SAM-dependent methyltransferase [Novipirellula aureliae]|uniref:class I SAM-dependent methyltransferase n=1 Tax=Novipirellula aureliae TaxID=2527966 RepID=UPI001E5C6933|nr:class I SAM-dependent methyltransferase [Novipirellula aureliae]